MSRAEYSCVNSGTMNLLSRTLSRKQSRPRVFVFAGFVFFRLAFSDCRTLWTVAFAGLSRDLLQALSRQAFASLRGLRFGFREGSIGHPLYNFALSGFMALLICCGSYWIQSIRGSCGIGHCHPFLHPPETCAKTQGGLLLV